MLLIVSAAGIPTLFVELLYSHILFFSRDSDSKAIGERIGVDMGLLREFQTTFSPIQQSDLTLQHFPVYGARLQGIQFKMNEWRPQRVRDLLVRPYKDPITFFAFMLAVLIGFVTILSFLATIAQTYVAFQSQSPKS